MDADQLADLIRRAQARNAAAFDALIDEFSPRLYGYLYRLTGSRHEAEDLLQDVFVRVVKQIGRYTHDWRFEGWLFRIATNLVRDRIRKAARGATLIAGDATDVFRTVPASLDGTDPAWQMETAEQIDQLQWALGQLSASEREVIMLRHFSELSFKEVAELMGTPMGTALARAHRGLQRLRSLMRDRTARDGMTPDIIGGVEPGPTAAF
ncbi:MAG: RNA polymerase sigma factor [Phycisphaerae bacterium]|nr:RNA polymerase sigma factor [Phycisphaerae bacterium]